MEIKGKVINILANFYYVQDSENKVWECFARARLLKEGKNLFVGDMLEIEPSSKDQAVIVNLLQRKNKISKPQVANVDQVLIVFSTCEPEFDYYNLDRYLSYIQYELPKERVVICINKMDLRQINIDKIYKKCGFEIYYVSALTKDGLESLANELVNQTTVLAGPSGVGKSSLIKAIAPEISIKIGNISRIKTGTHATRNIELISIKHKNEMGFLVDTPGFTQISFCGLQPQKILSTFPEFCNVGCGFQNCLHIGEATCNINDMIIKEPDLKDRLDSYMKILEESKKEIVYGKKTEAKVKTVGGKKEKKKVLPKIDVILRTKSRKREKQELLDLEDELEN